MARRIMTAAARKADQQFVMGEGFEAVIEGPADEIFAVVIDGDVFGVGRSNGAGVSIVGHR